MRFDTLYTHVAVITNSRQENMRFKSLPKPAVCLTLRRRLARPAECAPFVKRLSMNYEETTSHRELSTTRVQAAWWFLIIAVAFRKYPARRGAARGKLGIHLCKSGNFRKWTFDVLCVSRATTELGWRIFCSLSPSNVYLLEPMWIRLSATAAVLATRGDPLSMRQRY